MKKLLLTTIDAAEHHYQRIISFREAHALSFLTIVLLLLVIFSILFGKILSMIDFWYWSPLIAVCLGFPILWIFLDDSSLDLNNLSSQFGGKKDQINGARAFAIVLVLFILSFILYFSYFDDLGKWVVGRY